MSDNTLKKGDRVTISQWHPNACGFRDNSWVGDLLTIKAVQLPFVAVADVYGMTVSLDIRRCDIVHLNDDFAEALAKDEWAETIEN